ncbi:hypothetical protein ACP4OV_001189 [Aristida adscensionis]
MASMAEGVGGGGAEDAVKCSAEVGEGAYFMASILAVTGIMAGVLVLSGLFHWVLRRVDQPSVISHILAGIVVGPTVLGRAMDLRPLGMHDAGTALSGAIYFVRIIFMFFIGLELDLRYLRRHLRRSLGLACGGSAVCFALAALGGPFFYGLLHPGHRAFSPAKLYASTALFALVLTSTASPVLIRIVTELKLTASETGQLAMGAAFANDMASLAVLSALVVSHTMTDTEEEGDSSLRDKLLVLALMALTVWAAMSASAGAARLLNRLKRGRQYISKYELCAVLLLVLAFPLLEQIIGYSASMTAFLMGLAMPREGPTARALLDRLAYPVHQLIMPLCFGAIGARLDFAQMGRFSAGQLVAAVAYTTLLSAAGKVAGTVLAGRALGVPAREAVVLGVLLNVKGYSDILAISFGDKVGVWGETAQVVLLLSSIINTLMAGPASAAIVRQHRRASRYRSRCLQDLRVDHELRLVVCVHDAAGVHPALALADLSKGTALLAVYLLHLVELATSRKYAITRQLLLQQEDDADADDEWGYAREIEQVAAAVAAFTYDNAMPVRQMTAISNLASMDADVRNGVDDARASLLIVPFHKEQRYDGRMVCRRDGRRLLNQRLLHRPPCTVGILVERRHQHRAAAAADRHQVAALFLGGPDDREAVAYAARLAAHPAVSVTVCRFLLPSPSAPPDEEDEEFMAELHAASVLPGLVSYAETYVSNGAETVTALSSMAGTYSLMVVGKASSGAGAEAMTTGMGDWDDDCPELGPVGELLASDDLQGGGSVLVLQQHSVHRRRRMRTWKQPLPLLHHDHHHHDAVLDAA